MKYSYCVTGIDETTAHGKILSSLPDGSTVLECGCATGYLTKYMTEQKRCEVFGIEIDPDGARQASKYARHVQCADLSRDRWDDLYHMEQFDVILFADVLEHLTNPEDVLRRAVPLLKADGRVIISVPNIAHNDLILKLLNNRFDYTELGLLDNTHVHFWAANNLADLAHSCGLTLETVDGTLCRTGMSEQFSQTPCMIDPDTYEVLRRRREGEVYQYVVVARKQAYAQAHHMETQILLPGYDSSIRKVSLKELMDKCSDLTRKMEASEAQQAQLMAEKEALSRKQEDAEQQLKEQARAAEAGKALLEERTARLQAMGKDLAMITEVLKDARTRVELLEEKNAGMEKAMREAAESREQETNETLIRKEKECEARLKACEEDLRSQLRDAQARVTALESLRMGQEAQITALRNNHQTDWCRHEAERADLKNEIQALKGMNSEYEAEIRDLRAKNDELTVRTQQMTETARELNSTIDGLKAETEEQKRLTRLYSDRCDEYTSSRSWKMTAWYRRLGGMMKNAGKKYRRKMAPIPEAGERAGDVQPAAVPQDPAEALKANIRARCTNVNRGMVSVVIPIYDRTDVLRTSIESILNQTYQNLELILVCDGSPKATLDIVEKYRRNPKVRIYTYPDNSGNAVRGRNLAIREALGEYLAFQDSDDIAEPDRLALSVACMEQEHADVVYGGWRALIEDRKVEGLTNGQEVFSPDCDLEFLKKVCVPCQSTVMCRTAALRDVGGLKPDMRYREDHELWVRLAYYGYKFKAIQKVLTNLRLHGNNLELSFKDNDSHWADMVEKEYKTRGRLPKRIGFLIAGTTISGGVNVICTYANHLKQAGYDVFLINTGEGRSIPWFEHQDVGIFSVDCAPKDLDILVSTFWLTDYFAEHLDAKRKLYLVQSDERKFYDRNTMEKQMVAETYERQDREFMVIARWMQEWMKSEYGRDAVLIPNGIDVDRFAGANALAPRNQKRLRVLVEGAPKSGLKNVAAAFDIVKGLDVEIWYVNPTGEPSDFPADRVFHRLSQKEMAEVYKSCDVLLKTSRFESFCLPALEMMAGGGVPVVARVNGVDEFIQTGTNGYIFEQNDLQKARKIISGLAANRKRLHQLGYAAKNTARQYDWQKSYEKLDELIAGA